MCDGLWQGDCDEGMITSFIIHYLEWQACTVDLQIHLIQRLLDIHDVLSRHLDQAAATPPESAYGASFARRTEAGLQQADRYRSHWQSETSVFRLAPKATSLGTGRGCPSNRQPERSSDSRSLTSRLAKDQVHAFPYFAWSIVVTATDDKRIIDHETPLSPMQQRFSTPANYDDFERICRDILRLHWDCPSLDFYGRRGERQYGIDLIDTSGQVPMYAAQCKLKEEHKDLLPAEIDDEVNKAKGSTLPLKKYAILTTAKTSTRAQNRLIEINKAHTTLDLFQVELFTCQHMTFRVIGIAVDTVIGDVTRRVIGDQAAVNVVVGAKLYWGAGPLPAVTFCCQRLPKRSYL